MIGRDQIEAMIPHKGGMCLWDTVTGWDDRSVRLRTATHRDPANPLRSDDRLRAIHLCEFGAQAMAVHGGLRGAAAGGEPKVGFLVALRDVQLHLARIDDLPGDLECEAELLAESPASQQYVFRVLHAGVVLAEGRAAVMLQP
ncbi:MAG: phosphotransferase [Xanthomonadaceae bacterium]|nr:phosphotransferase [Xanthomonadaceae bacterium]